MKTHATLALVLFLALLGRLTAAAPTIQWQLNNPAINPNDKRLVPVSTWYEIRADAYDSDGNLAEIRIFKDGQPFAFAGAANPSHVNWGGYSMDSSPGFHVFSAYAFDQNNNYSPTIYWLVKVSAGAQQKITYADLLGAFNISATEARFPNTGNRHINAMNLAEVAQSLTNWNGYTLSFSPEGYEFDISMPKRVHNPVNDASDEPEKIDSNGYYNHGRGIEFNGVYNFTLKGTSGGSGSTYLKWASCDSNGNVFYQVNDSNKAAPISGFLRFGAANVNVWVQHIAFDTPYTKRDNRGGRHLDVLSTGFYLSDCDFFHAPNFAINITEECTSWPNTDPTSPGFTVSDPAYVHIDSSYIADTFCDGIHVQGGHDIWLVGNILSNTGDDAIAFVNGTYNDKPNTKFTTNFHVLSNSIWNSAGVGIGGGSCAGVSGQHSEVTNNYIWRTGSSALSFNAAAYSYTAAMEWIDILGNTIDYAGGYTPTATTSGPANPFSQKAGIEIQGGKNFVGYNPGQTTGWNKITNGAANRILGNVNQGNITIGLTKDSQGGPDSLGSPNPIVVVTQP